MKAYNTLLLLSLLFVQSIGAKNPTSELAMPRIVYAGEESCNIPPPTPLNVLNVGTGWVEVGWTPIIGATQYRLQAFDSNTGDGLGAPIFVGGGASSATISTVGSNGIAYVRIWSVCENGGYDPNNYTQSSNFDTIIIDVVATGVKPPENYNLQVVGVGPGYGVNVPWGVENEAFKVRYFGAGGALEPRNFGLNIQAAGSPDYVNFKIGENGNAGQHIIFVKEFNSQGDCIGMLIKYRTDASGPEEGLLIATIRISRILASDQGKVYRISSNSPFCIIERYVPTAPGFQSGTNAEPELARTSNVLSSEQISVAPNPFGNSLNIQLPETNDPTERVIHLYDLRGMQRITCQVPAKQTEYSMNTEQLEPGMYFLRIETGGKTETIKLMKTQ